MNWEAIGAIGEILGALVVIATVLYLSRQVRESNKHAQAEAERETQEKWNHYIDSYTRDPIAREVMRKGYYSFDNLSNSEKSVFMVGMAQFINHLDMVLRMESKGLLSKEFSDSIGGIVVSLIATSGGREFWKSGATSFQPLSREYISNGIESPDILSFTDIYPFWAESSE